MTISDLYSSMRALYDEWSDFLINPNFIQPDNQITWPNRHANFVKDTLRLSHVKQMTSARQYSFQIFDDFSLLQLFYQYERGHLVAANLGYYSAQSAPKPIDEDILLSQTSIIPLEDDTGYTLQDLDFGDDSELIGWFRIDYDPKAKSRGVIHHDCHMHFGGLPNSRFIVDGVPTPRQFVEFVIAMCYPDHYSSTCLTSVEETATKSVIWKYTDLIRMSSVNASPYNFSAPDICDHLTHLKIPLGISKPVSTTIPIKQHKVKRKKQR